MFDFNMVSFRELKGAPLSVLMVLKRSSQPQNSECLQDESGYTDKPIKRALKFLQNKGYVDKTKFGWILLPSSTEPGAPSKSVHIQQNDDNQQNESRDENPECQGNSQKRKIIPGGSSSSNNPLNTNAYDDLNTNTTTPIPKKSAEEMAAIWMELKKIGVRKNQRTMKMSEMEHVTVSYICAIKDKLEQEGRGGLKNIGLFIIACENAEPVENYEESVKEKFEKFLRRKS